MDVEPGGPSLRARPAPAGTNTAGGVTTPSTPAGGGRSQPADHDGQHRHGWNRRRTTAGARGSDDNVPARAMVKMTKADLQNAPEFRYSSDTNRANTGSAGNTNPPPASANRPGTAPQQ